MELKTEPEALDKIDINIMYSLYLNNKNSKLNSAISKNIMGYFKKDEISYTTLSRKIRNLEKLEYIEEGYKYKRFNSYYLSKKGVDFINKNILVDENAYEDVDEDLNIEEVDKK